MAGLVSRLSIVILFTVGLTVAAFPAGAQPGTGVASPEAVATGLDGAVTWLISNQAEDGGFIGFDGVSEPGATLDAIIALVAAERAGVDAGDAPERAIAFLQASEATTTYIQTGPGQAAKYVLALTAAGVSPSPIAGTDPVAVIIDGAEAGTGLYGSGVFDHALAIMALVAAGNDVPPSAIDALATTQAENGGWAFDASTDPAMADSNTTAIVIQALVAIGEGDGDLVASGLDYLDATWLDGGAAYSTLPDTLPDANSTALAIQAMIAAGRDVSTYVDALASFQNPTGAFHYNAEDVSDNLYATNGVIPALAGQPFPVLAASGEATPAATPGAIHVPLAA